MPQIGEISRGFDVGLDSPKKVMWCACLDCGKERWVFLKNGEPQSKRCHPCGAKYHGRAYDFPSGESHPNWKGGRSVTDTGYIQITLPPEHPFYVMTDKRGRVFEHRLVVAEALGRPLESLELVHHINANKQDNKIENLQVLTREEHSSINGLKDTNMMQLQARIKELENELLRYKQKFGDL